MKTKVNKSTENKKGHSPFFPSKTDSGFLGQPKLKVGQPGDKYEQEADRVAEEVTSVDTSKSQPFFSLAKVHAPKIGVKEKPLSEQITPLIHGKEAELYQTQPMEEEEELIQTQPLEEEEEELMPKRDSSLVRQEELDEQTINNTKGNGAPIDEKTRSFMEKSFGADFSNVNIHTDNTAVKLNKKIGAQAFATGKDVYFNEGKYRPKSQNGKKLLAHELAHTIQQGSSPINKTIQRESEEDTTTQVAEMETTSEVTSCDEATQRQKDIFRNHGIYGPRSLSPRATKTGGFEASYDPSSEVLNITVRGKTRFVNGLNIGGGVVASQEADLSGLARLLNYIGDDALSNNIVNTFYTWNETQKETAIINFRNRIAETIQIWQDEPFLIFHIDEPCWDDIFATVSINIDVQDEGTAVYSERNNASNDHLQVSLVKNPERSELQSVRNLIQTTARRIGDERMETIDTSARYTTGARVSSSRMGGGRNENPYDSELTLSNQALQNTPNEVNNFNRALLRTSVLFANNESVLDAGDKSIIDTFINDFTESDTNATNSRVRLIGHASRLGSTRSNERLVNARITSVMNYLRQKGFPNIDARVQAENRSDTMAERFDDTEHNASLFRRVEIVVGEGELQNTVAHEFGHVFGLLDEYATVGTSFTGTGTRPGTVVRHSGMSENIGAGRVQSENSDNIMSMGNEVRGQHYGPFGWALNRLTGKNWSLL